MKLLFSTIVMVGLFFSACSTKHEVATATTPNDTKETNAQQSQTKIKNYELENTQINEKVLNDGTVNKGIYLVHSVYFDFDQFGVKRSMKDAANENIVLAKNHLSQDASAHIVLEGNCDNVGTDEYNFGLGLKRAKSVKDTLLNAGIPNENIIIKSLGESNPLCEDETTQCHALNRRVNYIINT